MSGELARYNYDVVTITPDDVYIYGELKANESVIISIEDKMKQDIEQRRDRDNIIKNFIINPDIGFCLGFNFEGMLTKRDGSVWWNTRVFYYSPNKAKWDNFKWGGKY